MNDKFSVIKTHELKTQEIYISVSKDYWEILFIKLQTYQFYPYDKNSPPQKQNQIEFIHKLTVYKINIVLNNIEILSTFHFNYTAFHH